MRKLLTIVLSLFASMASAQTYTGTLFPSSSPVGLLCTVASCTFSAPILAPAGSAALPGIAFSTDPDTGIYQLGASTLRIGVDGTYRLYLASVGAVVNGSVGIGNAGQFQFSSAADFLSAGADTGLARAAAGIVSITNGSSGTGIVRAGDGDNTTPGYSFTNSTGTGMYRAASNRLRFATAGVFAWEIDGNGNLYGATGSQGLYSYVTVVAANVTTLGLTAAYGQELFTNTGDADGSAFTLIDNPGAGVCFEFVVRVAQAMTINAASGESIQDAATNGTSTVSSTVGSTMRVCSVTAGSGAVWQVMFKTGVWVTT